MVSITYIWMHLMTEKNALNVEAFAMKEHLECISGSEEIHFSRGENPTILEKNAFELEVVAMNLECIFGCEKNISLAAKTRQ